MTRLQLVLVYVAVFAAIAITVASTLALLVMLPTWLKPLAISPGLIFYRYVAGNTWIECGCLAVVIFVIVAIAIALKSAARALVV